MTLPRIPILIALVEHFQTAAAAVAPADQFSVRHYRHRDPDDSEWDCVSVQWVSDDPSDATVGGGDDLSTSEAVWTTKVNLFADAKLKSEDDASIAADPTGWGRPSFMIQTLLDSLFADGEQPETLGGLLYDITYDGTVEGSDDSTPDQVRLAEGLTLVYRVRGENQTSLLMG